MLLIPSHNVKSDVAKREKSQSIVSLRRLQYILINDLTNSYISSIKNRWDVLFRRHDHNIMLSSTRDPDIWQQIYVRAASSV